MQTRYVVLAKMQLIVNSRPEEYTVKGFDKKPTEKELKSLWDSLTEQHHKVFYLKVEVQVRFEND